MKWLLRLCNGLWHVVEMKATLLLTYVSLILLVSSTVLGHVRAWAIAAEAPL